MTAEARAEPKRKPVVVVWDRDGNFFQNWTADFKNGDGIRHGVGIAGSIGGSYLVLDETSFGRSDDATPMVRRDFNSDVAHLEIDDGVAIFRDGALSVTVRAETATVYDYEADMPAERVPLNEVALNDAIERLARSRSKPIPVRRDGSLADTGLETIVAAAIYHGSTISLPRPARHSDILQTMSIVMKVDATQVPPLNEGFLTSGGRFVNRIEAYGIAWRAGQLLSDKDTPELFSEDLW